MVRSKRTIRRLAAVALAFMMLGLTFPQAMYAKAKHLTGKHKHKHGHRHHFTKESSAKNRLLALDFLRLNSPSLSQLANLPPVATTEIDRQKVADAILEQSEEVPDEAAIGDTSAEAIQYPEDAVELEKYDDVKVDIDVFRKVWLNYVEHSSDSTVTPVMPRSAIDKRRLMSTVIDWLGTPYYYGGTTRKGIDCSGFTRMVIDSAAAVALPRSAHDQFLHGTPVDDNDMKFGDLVFFHTRRRPFVSHVGIYLGENLFCHSSSRYGVTISSLQSTYYSQHFIESRRVVPEPTTAIATPEEINGK